jgi:UDP-N-acetylmuramoylalanine--D-glutamate ligase
VTALPIPPAGRKALVLGLGRFGGGTAAARFLHRRGAAIRIADRSSGPDLDHSRQSLQDLAGVDWQLGREDEDLLAGIDLLVVNPAIPDQHPLLAAARRRGIELTQEVSLFLAHYPGRVVAVTGTNGKSSTSTMLHAALLRAGIDALLGGNIGHSLLEDEGRWHRDQIAVLEISSFQLDRVDPHRHTVFGAVLTRMGKDHVDRHGSLESYHRAKSILPAIATAFCVHCGDDAVASAFATPAPRFAYANAALAHATAGIPNGAGIDHGWLAVRLDDRAPVRLVHSEAMAVLGDFQRENALAAGLAATLLGASAHGIGLALANMAPLPFRLQLLAVLGGVRIYDNGVSTEIESTRSALRNLTGPLHWVAGGKSKDGDYGLVAREAAPYIASAHVFGTAAAPLCEQLSALARPVETTAHERLPAALDAAFAACEPGSALLFSPGFASFDQYPNFRARALEFHAWVAAKRQLQLAGLPLRTAGMPPRLSGTTTSAAPREHDRASEG